MTTKKARLLTTSVLALAAACGGAQVKPTPNDEVTTPLGALDQAALEDQRPETDEAAQKSSSAESDDASDPEVLDTTSQTP